MDTTDYDPWPLADAIIEDSMTARCGHRVECTEVCENCGQCIECCQASIDYVKTWPLGPGYKKEVLFVSNLKDMNLENCQIGLILQLMDNTCNECWDAFGVCHCSKDK